MNLEYYAYILHDLLKKSSVRFLEFNLRIFNTYREQDLFVFDRINFKINWELTKAIFEPKLRYLTCYLEVNSSF